MGGRLDLVERPAGQLSERAAVNVVVRLTNAVHWLALAAWMSALVTAGVAAMNTFSQLPKMGVALREFAALPADEHGRLAAGMVMERVFATVDWIQIIAAPLAVLSLVILLALTKPSWRSIPNLLRCFCIIVAAGLLAIHISALAPKMNQHLHGYWDDLRANRLPQAQSQLESFNHLHPIADRLLKFNLLLLIVGMAASAMTPVAVAAPLRGEGFQPAAQS